MKQFVPASAGGFIPNDIGASYGAGWTYVQNGGFYQDNDEGSSLQIPFTGDGITVLGVVAHDYDNILYTIDGGQTVTSSSTNPGTLLEVTGLSSGSHWLTVLPVSNGGDIPFQPVIVTGMTLSFADSQTSSNSMTDPLLSCLVGMVAVLIFFVGKNTGKA